MARKPDMERVVRGRMVHAFRRRGYVQVVVYAGPEATGEAVGDWDMPNAFRYNLDSVVVVAEAQTPGSGG